MTEASWCIYTLIYRLIRPTTNHYPGNRLGHLWIVEHPNVHIISLQLVIHGYACEHWLIATESYVRIPTHIILPQVVAHWFLRKWVFTHSYRALQMNSNNIMGLGKHGGNILMSIQAALLKYITSTSLYMYSTCFIDLSSILNVTGNQP